MVGALPVRGQHGRAFPDSGSSRTSDRLRYFVFQKLGCGLGMGIGKMTSTLEEKVYTDWLPNLSFRDRINLFRQNCKFKWVPFRGYYRFRSYKYMKQINPEMGLLRFLMNHSMISLDVGANLGLFTYFLARYSKHVHAFEPNPLAFDILCSIADRNVTLHREALTDRTGEAELLVPRSPKGWSNNGASLSRIPDGLYGRVRVAAARIDDLDLCNIGFIKIDVEGHELSVLRGAEETLRRNRPNLFVENETTHAGSGVFTVFELLSDLDYDGFFLDNGIMTHISRFSPEEHQTLRRATPSLRESYVKNFIFLPCHSGTPSERRASMTASAAIATAARLRSGLGVPPS